MKTLSKPFLKTIRIFVIVLAFTCSSNINATTSVSTNVISTSTPVMSTSLYATSTAQYALTWGWEWIKNLFKGGGGNQGGGGSHGGGDSVPLDGGLSILLAGAAFFGIKKLRNKKNDKI